MLSRLTDEELDFLIDLLNEYEEDHPDLNQRQWGNLKALQEKLEEMLDG
jgi:hypothetical protein